MTTIEDPIGARRIVRGVRQRGRRWLLGAVRRRTRPAPLPGVLVSVVGPGWLEELVEPSAALVAPGSVERPHLIVTALDRTVATSDTPRLVIAADGTGRRPVQHRTANPSVRRVAAGLPDALRAAAVDACRPSPPPPSPTDGVEAWLAWQRASCAAHQAYRAAMSWTIDDAIAGALGRPTIEPVVTVLCVSRRPAELERVVANFERQRYRNRELVLVAHGDGFDDDHLRRRLCLVERARWTRADRDMSLGACLELGLTMSTAPYFAKFDDDDVYGEHYLSDAMLAHRFAEAGVVGKHSTFALIESEGAMRLRFPGREFEYTSFVAGGTLVVDRGRIGDVRFPDLSVGEDGEFLRRCELAGVSVYSADRFNYIQRRTTDNTWRIDHRRFSRGSVVVGAGADLAPALV